MRKDERKYYEELLKYSRDHLMLYPYHLSDIMVKGLRVTPFSYYIGIMEVRVWQTGVLVWFSFNNLSVIISVTGSRTPEHTECESPDSGLFFFLRPRTIINSRVKIKKTWLNPEGNCFTLLQLLSVQKEYQWFHRFCVFRTTNRAGILISNHVFIKLYIYE